MWIRWMGNDLQMYTLSEWHRTSKSTCSRILNVPCKRFRLFSFFIAPFNDTDVFQRLLLFALFLSYLCSMSNTLTNYIECIPYLHFIRSGIFEIIFFRLPDRTIKKFSPLYNLAEWPSTRAKKCFSISAADCVWSVNQWNCERKKKNSIAEYMISLFV